MEVQPTVVGVMGGDGKLGKALVENLTSNPGLLVKALVKSVENYPVFSDSLELLTEQESLLVGVNILCLVPPCSSDRASSVAQTINVAQKCGVEHILLFSMTTAGLGDTIFGRQFGEMEKAVMDADMEFTILRVPLYLDNYLAYEYSVRHENALYGPLDPSIAYTPVAMDDVALVASVIAASPEKHAGKIYPIASDRHTFGDVAAAFTKVLNRQVKYTRVPYEETKALLQQHRFPEWQAEGIVEMYRLVDQGSRVTNTESLHLFEEITGKMPTDLENWVAKHINGFK